MSLYTWIYMKYIFNVKVWQEPFCVFISIIAITWSFAHYAVLQSYIPMIGLVLLHTSRVLS
jgi:hypothetical protein